MRKRRLACFFALAGLSGFLLYFLTVSNAQTGDRSSGIRMYMPDTSEVRKLILDTRNLAITHRDSAAGLYLSALRQSRIIGYENGYTGALMELGSLYLNHLDYRTAIRYLREAASYCNPEKFPRNYFTIHNNLGIAFMHLFEFERAFRAFHTAMNYVSDTSEHYGYLMVNMANCMRLAGNHDKAVLYMNRAMKLADRFRNDDGRFGFYFIVAQLHLKTNSWDIALQFADSALAVAGNSGNYSSEVMALRTLSEINGSMGNLKTAAELGMKAYALTEKYPVEQKVRNSMCILMGTIYLEQREYRKAEQFLQKALTHAGESAYDRKFLLRRLADLYEETGDYRKSGRYLQAYHHFTDSLQASEQVIKLSEVEARYRMAEKDRELLAQRLKSAEQDRMLGRRNVALLSVSALALLLTAFFAARYRYRKNILLKNREILRLRSVMEGEEQERMRLSRELHDGIGSMLTGAMMHLKVIQQQEETPDREGSLGQLMFRLAEIGRELHKTAHNLTPEVLESHDLGTVVQLYCDQVSAQAANLQIRVQVFGNMHRLDPALALALYRVLQELVQNILKHSDADTAEIQLREAGGVLTILVEDNGKGFEWKDSRDVQSHLGLHNIRRRVEAADGYLSISSSPGAGTIICIEIDLSKEKWKKSA